jgi:hypothetical protein
MNLRRLAASSFAALVALACGGKVPSLDDAILPDGGRAGPPPTCGAVCAHIIGSCVPGASTDKCVTDCEDGTMRFATTCPVELDSYLRCMITTSVECHMTDVVVVGCSPERDRLEACRP